MIGLFKSDKGMGRKNEIENKLGGANHSLASSLNEE